MLSVTWDASKFKVLNEFQLKLIAIEMIEFILVYDHKIVLNNDKFEKKEKEEK